MTTPAEFFKQSFDYLKTVPVLQKPSQQNFNEYLLYQLLQCYVSYEDKKPNATIKILDYVKSLITKRMFVPPPLPFNNVKSYLECESDVRSDEEKQTLRSMYEERTLKRKLAYEQQLSNPSAFNEFNAKRKKIEHRRQTEPADSSRNYFDPPHVKSPGFVVSSQEQNAPDLSPYNPSNPSYEPSIEGLFADGYQPKVISTPAHLPPALTGEMEFAAEFTPRRSTEDLEANLAHVAANLEIPSARSRSPSRYRSVLRGKSRSKSRQRSPSRSPSASSCASSHSGDSRKSRSRSRSHGRSRSRSVSSCSPSPVRRAPLPRKHVARNRTKGVAFMIKDKGVYACMSGYSSYLKSKIKRTQGTLLVEPMYINDDKVDLADVWTMLSQKLLNKFPALSKINKTLKAKSISDVMQNNIKAYIQKQLRKLNFD